MLRCFNGPQQNITNGLLARLQRLTLKSAGFERRDGRGEITNVVPVASYGYVDAPGAQLIIPGQSCSSSSGIE